MSDISIKMGVISKDDITGWILLSSVQICIFPSPLNRTSNNLKEIFFKVFEYPMRISPHNKFEEEGKFTDFKYCSFGLSNNLLHKLLTTEQNKIKLD